MGAFCAFIKKSMLERWQEMMGESNGKWHATKVPVRTPTRFITIHGHELQAVLLVYRFMGEIFTDATALPNWFVNVKPITAIQESTYGELCIFWFFIADTLL